MESKCNTKCMYYKILEKDRKYKGFCDHYGVFFESLTEKELKERTEGCEFCKSYPTTTGL